MSIATGDIDAICCFVTSEVPHSARKHHPVEWSIETGEVKKAQPPVQIARDEEFSGNDRDCRYLTIERYGLKATVGAGGLKKHHALVCATRDDGVAVGADVVSSRSCRDGDTGQLCLLLVDLTYATLGDADQQGGPVGLCARCKAVGWAADRETRHVSGCNVVHVDAEGLSSPRGAPDDVSGDDYIPAWGIGGYPSSYGLCPVD